MDLIKRVVFLGTPQFAVPTLEKMVGAGYEVPLVVTQPDRPKGRGGALAASPVKQSALRMGLEVFQPERVRRPEGQARLAEIAPDAMVVVGYGQIIPQSIIDMAPRGIINVHASLLPKYRGAAPIQWAVANGETRTGVTTMRIDAGLDTGDMLLKAETEIGPEETAIELGARLAPMGADLLIETLAGLSAGTIVPEKQDASQATYAPILKKEDGRIVWSRPAREIHNQVRGLLPWPGAYTQFRGQTMNVWKARIPGIPGTKGIPGMFVPGLRRPTVTCGDGNCIEFLEVQLEGRKRISGEAFANGQRLTENDFVGAIAN